jgi:putative ABC transport system ATP-binding protein
MQGFVFPARGWKSSRTKEGGRAGEARDGPLLGPAMNEAAGVPRVGAAPESPVRPAPLISLEGITKIYRVGDSEIHPLTEVSLTIERGEFVAIMGASGSGKSTLMNLIGCLDRPTQGRYFLEGEEVSAMKPDRQAYLRNKKFGFVFQSFNLLARTSAIENVELPLLYWNRLSQKERRARALAALTSVGLAGRAGHTPGQLSGGEQQRVAIARALVTGPSVLLADEPTGNLDSKSEREVMSLIERTHEQGMTVMVITHNPEIASLAGRVIRLRDGRIQEPAP